jgi:hypothetical protein
MTHDLKGKRFGSLVAIESFRDEWVSGNNVKTVVKWRCQCDCGGIANPTTSKLIHGHTTGCHQCKVLRTTQSNIARGKAIKEYRERQSKEGDSPNKRKIINGMGGGLTRGPHSATLHALVHLNQLFTNPLPVNNPDSQED